MKIWFPVIKGGSGTDVFTRRLSEALQRRGIATEITWFSTFYQFAPFLLRFTSPPRGTTLIHANSWSGFAFKRPEIPLVVTEHLNVLDPLYGPYKSRAQRAYHQTLLRGFVMASFRAADAITSVSHFTASSLQTTLGIHSGQVIYDWIDTETFFPFKPNAGSANPRFRLLYIGNLSRRKGSDLLSLIMRELGQDFELGFTSGLKRLRKMPLARNMISLGRLNEEQIIQACRHCDALLFPSRFEGFGLAAVEAMACGKPVIATNSSSLPEVVEDGVTGILCSPNDVSAFVAACRKLSGDSQMLQRFGEAARRRVEKLFSEELIIPQYIALYEKLVK